MKEKNLLKIIQENPGCVAVIDNDNWQLYPANYDELCASEEDIEIEPLATSRDTFIHKNWSGQYGGYGGDLLSAMAEHFGMVLRGA